MHVQLDVNIASTCPSVCDASTGFPCVHDPACGVSKFGAQGCNAGGMGSKCRACSDIDPCPQQLLIHRVWRELFQYSNAVARQIKYGSLLAPPAAKSIVRSVTKFALAVRSTDSTLLASLQDAARLALCPPKVDWATGKLIYQDPQYCDVVVESRGVPSAPPPPDPCSEFTGPMPDSELHGDVQVGAAHGADITNCCQSCIDNPRCEGFVEFAGWCYLKSGNLRTFSLGARTAYLKSAPSSGRRLSATTPVNMTLPTSAAFEQRLVILTRSSDMSVDAIREVDAMLANGSATGDAILRALPSVGNFSSSALGNSTFAAIPSTVSTAIEAQMSVVTIRALPVTPETNGGDDNRTTSARAEHSSSSASESDVAHAQQATAECSLYNSAAHGTAKMLSSAMGMPSESVGGGSESSLGFEMSVQINYATGSANGGISRSASYALDQKQSDIPCDVAMLGVPPPLPARPPQPPAAPPLLAGDTSAALNAEGATSSMLTVLTVGVCVGAALLLLLLMACARRRCRRRAKGCDAKPAKAAERAETDLSNSSNQLAEARRLSLHIAERNSRYAHHAQAGGRADRRSHLEIVHLSGDGEIHSSQSTRFSSYSTDGPPSSRMHRVSHSRRSSSRRLSTSGVPPSTSVVLGRNTLHLEPVRLPAPSTVEYATATTRCTERHTKRHTESRTERHTVGSANQPSSGQHQVALPTATCQEEAQRMQRVQSDSVQSSSPRTESEGSSSPRTDSEGGSAQTTYLALAPRRPATRSMAVKLPSAKQQLEDCSSSCADGDASSPQSVYLTMACSPAAEQLPAEQQIATCRAPTIEKRPAVDVAPNPPPMQAQAASDLPVTHRTVVCRAASERPLLMRPETANRAMTRIQLSDRALGERERRVAYGKRAVRPFSIPSAQAVTTDDLQVAQDHEGGATSSRGDELNNILEHALKRLEKVGGSLKQMATVSDDLAPMSSRRN